MRKPSKRDAIPQHFRNVADAADFWDTHDLADYGDATKEVSFEVDIRGRVFAL